MQTKAGATHKKRTDSQKEKRTGKKNKKKMIHSPLSSSYFAIMASLSLSLSSETGTSVSFAATDTRPTDRHTYWYREFHPHHTSCPCNSAPSSLSVTAELQNTISGCQLWPHAATTKTTVHPSSRLFDLWSQSADCLIAGDHVLLIIEK